MTSGNPRRRLQEVSEASEPDRFGISQLARRVPRSQAAGALAFVALVAARAAGVTIPGSAYVHKVFADPLVYFFVRLTVVGLLILVALTLTWIAGSLASHIRNRRWIRRIAGLEPQALHQGATEMEQGYEQVLETLKELAAENVELASNLEMTSLELRAANIALEKLRNR